MRLTRKHSVVYVLTRQSQQNADSHVFSFNEEQSTTGKMTLSSTWKKLMTIGLKPETRFKERIRIELCNQFVAIGLLFVITHFIIGLLFIRSAVDLAMTALWFSMLITALLINLSGRLALSRSFLVFCGILVTVSIHLIFGPAIRVESMYILFIICSVIFFDRKLMISAAVFALSGFFAATIYCNLYQSPLADSISPSGPISRFAFSTIMIISLISKLIYENRSFNRIVQKQNKSLTQANRHLKSFNYIISHDLREPVRSIVSFSQLMKHCVVGEESDEHEYLDYIIKSGKQLNQLLDDIKDFQKSSEWDFETEIVDVAEVIKEVKENLSGLISEKNAEVNCGRLPVLYSSKKALFIVFKNLVENALKYNKQDSPVCNIESQLVDSKHSITVRDNGIGIEQQYYSDVFTMFKRLDAESAKGSGLGLNIVQNVLVNIDGKISISESTPREGTVFLIELPTKQAA